MKTWLLLLGGLGLAGLLAFLFLSNPNPAADADPDSGTATEQAGRGQEAGTGTDPASGAVRSEVLASSTHTSPGLSGSGFGQWNFAGPGAVIRARLVDPAGKAAAGAEARQAGQDAPEAWMVSEVQGDPIETEQAAVPVNADGRVELRVPAGQALNLEFGGPYWRSQTRRIQALRPDEVADFGEIALTPACRLVGRTLGPQGLPLANVQTRLRAADAGMFWEGHALIQSRTSDAQGVVVFDGVPLGRFRIEGETTGFASAQIEALEVRSAPGDVPFELKLDPGAQVSGRVVDADRRPVAQADVFLFRQDQGTFYWGDYQPPFPDREPDARSGADGSFVLTGLPKDGSAVVIGARAEGQVSGFAKKVKAGMAEVTVVLPRALGVRGRVLGNSDAPVAGCRVWLTQKTPWGWDEEKGSVESDAEGNFALTGLAPGEFLLHASAAGSETEPLPLALDRELSDIVLRVAERPALAVRVLDADGRPLARSKVDLNILSAPAAADAGTSFVIESSGSFSFSQGPGWSNSAVTDEDGRARFYDAPSGELRIQARHAEWARADVVYHYTGGAAETVVELLRPAQLLVRVTDGAGGLVRNVSVRLRNSATGRETEEQRTDHLGRAYWPDLLPGPWEILHGAGTGGDQSWFSGDVAWTDNAEAAAPPPAQTGAPVELIAGQCVEKELVLNDLAVVTVRVLRNGAPAADVFARLEPRSEDNGMAWGGMHGGSPSGLATDGRGMVVLDPVSAGKYDLIVRPSRNAPDTRQEVDLVAGPQSLTARLNGAEVRGIVRSPAGPVVGARMSLSPYQPEGEPEARSSFVISMVGGDGSMGVEFGEDNGVTTMASSDQDGEYLFKDVPEGSWTVKAQARGFAPWTSLPFTVSGDTSVTLPEQLLLPGGEISGRDANWKAKAEEDSFGFDWSNSIRLENAAGRMMGIAQTTEGGEYRFADLAEGEYFVRRGEWKSEAIRIGAGERRRQDVPVAVPQAKEN